MSSPLAIAGVTAVLRDLLNNAMIDHQASTTTGSPVTVTTQAPDRIKVGDNEETQLNLFLYQVTLNPGWRNVGLPSYDSGGACINNPPLALDLHYLLTAYGKADFVPEILLGYAMQRLHETPVLTRNNIRTALGGVPPLNGSILPGSASTSVAADLADQIEQVKIIPQQLSMEEISKLWMATQAHYRPTVAYQVSVILIESNRPTRQTLPVRERIIKVIPFQQPTIDSVESIIGPEEPIVANSILSIKGHQLRGDITTVLIGGIELTPAAGDLAEGEIKISLLPTPEIVHAGIQSAQVVHQIDLGKPEKPHRGVESNITAFVLHPEITVPATASNTLKIKFDPEVGRSQRVTLLLGERNPPAGSAARSFTLAAPSENGITAPGQTDTATITFSLADVGVGDFFVRARVDGAESSLTIDTAPGSPTLNEFNGPTVTIT